jgi:hypothetical protein
MNRKQTEKFLILLGFLRVSVVKIFRQACSLSAWDCGD